MKLQKMKKFFIALPILCLIPMSCMHFTDGHHSFSHPPFADHSLKSPSSKSPTEVRGSPEMKKQQFFAILMILAAQSKSH